MRAMTGAAFMPIGRRLQCTLVSVRRLFPQMGVVADSGPATVRARFGAAASA